MCWLTVSCGPNHTDTPSKYSLAKNGDGWNEFIASDLSLAMLLALFSLFFCLLAFYMWISACICFCIYRFLHFFFSVFRSSCISICLPPYPLHLLCISAFLHFCIARLLRFWICSRMLRCLSFCMFVDVRSQNFVNVRCFVFDFLRCS